MGYLHIENLYKAQEILALKECYALEKIHGTSAHISWDGNGDVKFFSGGEKHSNFLALFDTEKLKGIFQEQFPSEKVVIFGEAYGGKQQGMKSTYGDKLKFVVFDVKIGDCWLSVPQAHDVAQAMFGFEFVDYNLIPADMFHIDQERDRPSTQAVRNGITEEKMREGIVLRPVFEIRLNNGERLISKHKRAEFSEIARPKEIDPDKKDQLQLAESIALTWVTQMRLTHVIDRLLSSREEKSYGIEDTGSIIKLMVEDVKRESTGEVEWSKDIQKTISARAAKLLKQHLSAALEGK